MFYKRVRVNNILKALVSLDLCLQFIKKLMLAGVDSCECQFKSIMNIQLLRVLELDCVYKRVSGFYYAVDFYENWLNLR